MTGGIESSVSHIPRYRYKMDVFELTHYAIGNRSVNSTIRYSSARGHHRLHMDTHAESRVTGGSCVTNMHDGRQVFTAYRMRPRLPTDSQRSVPVSSTSPSFWFNSVTFSYARSRHVL